MIKSKYKLIIIPGLGGKDSLQISLTLFKLYLKYFKNYNIVKEYDEENLSIILNIEDNIFNKLKKIEEGNYKIIRLSPFTNKRQTSFLYISIIKDSSISIDISEKDIKIERYLSSSKGGQNANKVETAIRAKYIPLNIIATAQDFPDQKKNKKLAIERLKEKIFTYIKDNKKVNQNKLIKLIGEIKWGQNYKRIIKLYPYKSMIDVNNNINIKDFKSLDDIILVKHLDSIFETYQ